MANMSHSSSEQDHSTLQKMQIALFVYIKQWLKQDSTLFGLEVLIRLSAAMFGGYVAAATLACLLTQVLPLPRFDSTLIANMLAFIFYAIAIIYAFCLKTAWHGWRNLCLVSLVCFGLLQLSGQ
ncbi:DUF3649 domain-containing protein [Shewanella acanthi]|uniref:DUF3649 domain-containing protein n=1 Tax=Shewanella acanthi TaxID=2864212 RepID=UPI001C661D5A|nr:DUF3649 domain-containing protein [Shewanella acanthi]QYJ79767.1 DUF3649 domain-containing protein [Shewanella acanthi]